MSLYIVRHNQGFKGIACGQVIELTDEEASPHLGDHGTGFVMEADPNSLAFTVEDARAVAEYRERIATENVASAEDSSADESEAHHADELAKQAAADAEAERKKTVTEILAASTATVPSAPEFGTRTPVLVGSSSSSTTLSRTEPSSVDVPLNRDSE